jgi:CRISPR-associated endonuclease/helicase Cas3
LGGSDAGDARRGRAARAAPSAIEREVLDLPPEDFDLVAYLVCAHHGKLRARLHAGAADQTAALRGGSLPIRGIYEGDVLPSVSLAGSDGALHTLPPSRMSLEPATLGLSALTGRSWIERVEALRVRFGPFVLA